MRVYHRVFAHLMTVPLYATRLRHTPFPDADIPKDLSWSPMPRPVEYFFQRYLYLSRFAFRSEVWEPYVSQLAAHAGRAPDHDR